MNALLGVANGVPETAVHLGLARHAVVARISNTGGLYTFTGSKLVTEFVALPLMPTSVDRWVKGSQVTITRLSVIPSDANLAGGRGCPEPVSAGQVP